MVMLICAPLVALRRSEYLHFEAYMVCRFKPISSFQVKGVVMVANRVSIVWGHYDSVGERGGAS